MVMTKESNHNRGQMSNVNDSNSFQSHEFLLFSFLMLLDMAVLAFMAIRYEYVDFTSGNNGRNGNNNAKVNGTITDDEDKID